MRQHDTLLYVMPTTSPLMTSSLRRQYRHQRVLQWFKNVWKIYCVITLKTIIAIHESINCTLNLWEANDEVYEIFKLADLYCTAKLLLENQIWSIWTKAHKPVVLQLSLLSSRELKFWKLLQDCKLNFKTNWSQIIRLWIIFVNDINPRSYHDILCVSQMLNCIKMLGQIFE